MKKIIAAVLMFLASSAAAQSVPADPISGLGSWLQSQQAQVGLSETLKGVKYAATWWDAVSVGQKGLNVGSAGAMDFFDMGPAFTGTNSTLASQDPTTRWGAATALHVGNLWNWGTGKMPEVLASHVHLVTLPNVTISPLFMWPHGTNVDKWTFAKDFQIAMAYRFGGTP